MSVTQKDKVAKKDIDAKHYLLLGMSYLRFLYISLNKTLFERYILMILKKRRCFDLFVEAARLRFKKRLTITIDPKHLTYTLKDWVRDSDDKIINTNHFFLGSGDWSNILFEIEKTPVYQETLELIKHDLDYKKTKFYAKYLENMNKNTPTKKQHRYLDSIEAVDAYFERFISLYKSIKQRGVVSAKNFIDIKNKEIGIVVLKDGSIAKLAGAQHRVSIAKKLNISAIPAEIRMIHKEYMDEVALTYSLGYHDAILKVTELTQKRFI